MFLKSELLIYFTYYMKTRVTVLKWMVVMHIVALSCNRFVIGASSTEPKPFYITVGHLNVGSVGRLIPTMSWKMPGKGPT